MNSNKIKQLRIKQAWPQEKNGEQLAIHISKISSWRSPLKYRRVTLMMLVTLGVVACNEKKTDQAVSTQTAGEKVNNATQAIEDQMIVGKVRNAQFLPEQAIIENGTLTLRQGQEFFADVSVEIITFENEDLSGKSFDSMGALAPHIILGIKKKGESLPNSVTLMSDYELMLAFGKKEALGIPFSIRLTSPKNETDIQGRAFASYADIQVLDGVMGAAIDVQFDSFDTLEYLAKKHLNLDDNRIGGKFGISYSGYGENYPKSGFVGYEIDASSNDVSLAKIQLAKDVDGWKVVNQLEANQIHQAHSVLANIEGSLRTVESVKATEAAGQHIEIYLNKQGLMPSVRATSVNCYLTKMADKASCSAVFGLKVDDGIECQSRHYLLEHKQRSWQIQSEILDTQKVDYLSGELVDKKPFAISCR